MKKPVLWIVAVLLAAAFLYAIQNYDNNTISDSTIANTVNVVKNTAIKAGDSVEEGVDDLAEGIDAAADAMADDAEQLAEEVDEAMDDDASDIVIDITGSNFSYSLETIEVNEGDIVTINFESTDGFHDWVVDKFNASTEKVNPGTPTSVTFVANAAGEYEYYCSVGEHRANGMVGKLIVRSNQEEGTIAQGEEETVIVNDGYQEFDEETMKRAVAEGQKVALFFHADWCPSCIALNENIVENEDTIENGTVVFKVDYDTAKDLTDKYNVTAQHTVVYLDEDMNATMTKGGVTSLDELVGNFDA